MTHQFSSWLREKIHFRSPSPLAGVQDLLCLHTHNFEFKTDDERSNTSLMFNYSLNFKYKVTAGGHQCLHCFKSTLIYIHLGFTGFTSVWWNSWSDIWFTASATTELSRTSAYLQILFSDKFPCNILYHNIKLLKTWSKMLSVTLTLTNANKKDPGCPPCEEIWAVRGYFLYCATVCVVDI